MRERNSATSTVTPYVSPRWTRRVACLLGPALVISLAGCAGDSSILDPAGPAARDVRLIWWVMLGFATIVLIGVTVVWLYAFKPRNVERTSAQERRIARRWIIGGGLVLPITSVTALLMFGVPAGQRMLPLPLGEPPEVIEVIGTNGGGKCATQAPKAAKSSPLTSSSCPPGSRWIFM